MTTDSTANNLDLSLLDEVLDPLAPQGRTALLPALHAAQSIYGYLPEAVAARVGRKLRVPLAEVYGVIDFFTMLYREPVGRQVVMVCGDPACSLKGGHNVLASLCESLAIKPGETTPDGDWTVARAPCLGLCEHAPAVLVNEVALSNVPEDDADAILGLKTARARGVVGGDLRILTKNCGTGKPTSLKDYVSGGGYAAVEKALTEMTPADVIAAVKEAGLVGRGGAAFPTGVKWEGAANAAGDAKYVICNADESEPGTFKDRILMEDDPHSTLEGMILAGYAIGANEGYLYIRGEYHRAAEILLAAIAEATEAGFLGAN
ncbi:MAG: NAD(P)H-dependent oxidoreductase subunit E, partial [Anaerolineales bacterium]